MSETRWTLNQSHAITSRGGSVLVSAAAGSGKTSVLVARLISLITDREHPMDSDRFLAVTFTNAAAANVAARLRSALERLISEHPDDRYLRRQNLLLRRSSISTVHSFCISLIREYFSLLEIPPDFTVCDALAASAIESEIISAVLSELYSDDRSGIKKLSDLFGRSRSDEATAELIRHLYSFENNMAFPEKWEAECIAELTDTRSLSDSAVGKMLLSYAKDALCSARALSVRALTLCGDDQPLESAYSPAIESDLNFINSALALIETGDWDSVRGAICSFEPKRFLSAKGADEYLKASVCATRKMVKDTVKELADKVFFRSEAEHLAENKDLSAALTALFGAVSLYRKRLFDEKLKRKSFDFSDLERLALSLLCDADGNKTQVAAEVSMRFDHILVDEYQDTNEIQSLIFRLVSRDESNLFFVGDLKQSVYGFRDANPEIFLNFRNRCYPDEAGLYPKKIFLSENFRSSRAVIGAINTVFSPIMSEKSGGTDYLDGERLVPCESSSDYDKTGLELHITSDCSDGASPKYVASLISSMINEGYGVEENGSVRPCAAKDFCIVLRAKDSTLLYKDALADAGISAWSDTSESFFDNSEVAVTMSLLRIIDNPRRDLELTAVMLSPLFGFTEDELLRLRLTDRRSPFYSLVLTSDDEKCRRFTEILSSLRDTAKSLGLADTVRLAIDKTNAEVLLCAGADIESRRNNLRLLIDYADSFGNADNASLGHFLAVCERAAKQGRSPVSKTFSPPSDAVSIISIHKSKGLEWPFVILAESQKGMNTRDSYDTPVLFNNSLFAGLKMKYPSSDGTAFYTKKSLSYSALSLASLLATKNEEMRILYVALTRAKQKIIVCGTNASPEKYISELACLTSTDAADDRIDAYTVNSKSTYLSWILLALLNKYPDEILRASESGEYDGDEIKVFIDRPVPEIAVAEKDDSEARADGALLAELEKRLCFRYKNEALSQIPTNLSVSELSKGSDGGAVYVPAFARRSLSGAEKGTAIHLFMQLADYSAASKSVDDELDRLVDGEYIDADAAKGINKAKLRAFFDSELGRTVVSSKHCLREFAFIDTISAGELYPELTDSDEKILIQGIADCILAEPDGATLIDYKSDRVNSAEQLVTRYSAQLELYRRALTKKLSVPIKRTVIYSFALEKAIEL